MEMVDDGKLLSTHTKAREHGFHSLRFLTLSLYLGLLPSSQTDELFEHFRKRPILLNEGQDLGIADFHDLGLSLRDSIWRHPRSLFPKLELCVL